MGLILALIGAAVVAVIGFGVTWLVAGRDPGMGGAEPDGVAVPLPSSRPLTEGDVGRVRFDTTLRGYRMGQVDAALRRAAYDIGYKEELINVLEAEVEALRDGRDEDAEALRRARTGAEPKPIELPVVASLALPAVHAWATAKGDATSREALPGDASSRGNSSNGATSHDDDESDSESADTGVNSANGVK